MNLLKEIVDVKKEVERRKKLSSMERLDVLDNDTTASELALRITLDKIDRDMTKLLKRVETLERGTVLLNDNVEATEQVPA